MISGPDRLTLVPESPADRPQAAHAAIVNRLTLFGGAMLDTASGPITGRAAQRHRLALLALLATTRRSYRTRDQLITVLWPETDPERGRKLLSDSIYRINQALGGDAIVGNGEDVRLNRAQIGSDVADFEAAVDAEDWRRVVEVYTGSFLDGFFVPDSPEFDQWMDGERAEYARSAARGIETLAVAARDAGKFSTARDWWQRLAALAPDDSRIAIELMRALEAAGNRAAAIRHAKAHSTYLRETLGVEADRSVRELAARMSRYVDTPAEFPAPNSAAAPRPGPAREPQSTAAAVGTITGTFEISRAVAKTQSSIAVLPFANVSDSENTSYFADGVSEELMYLLTRSGGVRVASRTSSFAYRELNLDVREVARRLNVDWILEGSVRRSGDTLRIVAQLTDARNGFHVWSESFDRTSSDIFAIQAEIAGTIANRIAPSVSGAGPASLLAVAATADADSYDLYLQARFQWHRRTDESLKKSAQLFEDILNREPNNARAWAGLAETFAVIAFYDYLAPRVAFPRADSAARRAIKLDPTLAAPFAVLAYVDAYFHWNGPAAERGFLMALELEPNNATARHWYGTALAVRGRFDEAEREMRRATELDPLSLIAQSALGWILTLADKNERAIHQLENALKLDVTFCLAHYWMATAYEQLKRPTDAVRVLQRSMELSPNNALVMASMGQAQAASGDLEAARKTLEWLLDRERGGRYISSYQLAKIYLALGDVPTALSRLERAFVDRAHSMAYLKVDPQLRSLADEPRFTRLVERVDP